MKKCHACLFEKYLSEFSKNKRMPDGLQQRCKDCCKQYREYNKIKNKSRKLDAQSLQCSECEQILDISLFSSKDNCPRGFDYWCKNCRNIYKQNNYSSNLEEGRIKNNNKRRKRIQWFWKLKEGVHCMDCNKVYEPYCMDYDHIYNGKIKAVSRMVLDNTSKEIILEEIKKCELVCLLCHNKRTHDRFNEKLGKDRKYSSAVQRNINIINNFKNHPCAICGKLRGLYNMQIDHINPSTKLYDVCRLKSFKIETLQDELDKCQVLCALCHRRKSIIEQQNDQYSVSRPKPNKRKKLFHDSVSNTKECGNCFVIKDGSLFSKDERSISGLFTYCKECFNEYKRKRRKRIKIKII